MRCAVYQRSWFGYCGPGAELEALAMAACGLPVVCPATEVAKEYVQDGRTGLLYHPGKAHELADRLGELIGDGALRTRLATEARAHIETRSWDKTAGLVLATIENLPRPTRDTVKGARPSLVRK
jgi:glycosyltransferase involved in cell wall biosynthesis